KVMFAFVTATVRMVEQPTVLAQQGTFTYYPQTVDKFYVRVMFFNMTIYTANTYECTSQAPAFDGTLKIGYKIEFRWMYINVDIVSSWTNTMQYSSCTITYNTI